ncbi:hypothetical protein [Streptococcus sp. zg-JUN1979]|uniref:hypothetical protein n=1 Tax=Streptococcus sp. zg-JUN1979 TaxID=3391450 RepID=UPI0039AF94A5
MKLFLKTAIVTITAALLLRLLEWVWLNSIVDILKDGALTGVDLYFKSLNKFFYLYHFQIGLNIISLVGYAFALKNSSVTTRDIMYLIPLHIILFIIVFLPTIIIRDFEGAIFSSVILWNTLLLQKYQLLSLKSVIKTLLPLQLMNITIFLVIYAITTFLDVIIGDNVISHILLPILMYALIIATLYLSNYLIIRKLSHSK